MIPTSVNVNWQAISEVAYSVSREGGRRVYVRAPILIHVLERPERQWLTRPQRDDPALRPLVPRAYIAYITSRAHEYAPMPTGYVRDVGTWNKRSQRGIVAPSDNHCRSGRSST